MYGRKFKMSVLKKSIIHQVLVSPVGRMAASVISFESLEFGTADERVFAWLNVKTVCLHVQSEHELNRWWRLVTPDASWKTAAELIDFANWKIEMMKGHSKC